MSDVRALLRPRRTPQLRTPKPRSNFGHDCGRCGHVWHGLDCRVAACTCMTAWTNPTPTTSSTEA